MTLDTIYNEDCLEGMKRIPDGSVDAIICDLPYGTMKGSGKGTGNQYPDTNHDWDEIIPSDKLFEQYERVLRRNGVIILFSAEPYTMHLRTCDKMNIEFLYPMIWKKNTFGMNLNARHAPVSYFEDINVFRKKVTLVGNHPLRQYFAKMIPFLGVPKTAVVKKLGTRAQHCFNVEGNQFSLCTAETYADLIEHYHIDKMEGFQPFDELKRIDREFKDGYTDPDPVVFNLPDGETYLSNVLEFSKDTDGFHPTQKPVALIRRIVLTYTNEGDTVLDNCMSSGTTAIACIKEKRHFIGFELSKEYFDKAQRRINNERSQLTLW